MSRILQIQVYRKKLGGHDTTKVLCSYISTELLLRFSGVGGVA